MWGAQAGGLWSLCPGLGKGALVSLCHCISKAFHILSTVHALLGLSFPFKEMQLVLSPPPQNLFLSPFTHAASTCGLQQTVCLRLRVTLS